jgi:hypothetical protein
MIEHDYYPLDEAAKSLHCKIHDLIRWAATGRIRLSLHVDGEKILVSGDADKPLAFFKNWPGEIPDELKPVIPGIYYLPQNHAIELEQYGVTSIRFSHCKDRGGILFNENVEITTDCVLITAVELEKAKGFIQPGEPQADQSTGKVIDSRSSLLIANFKSSLAESLTAEKAGTVQSDVAKGVIRHLDENPNLPGLNALLRLKGYLEQSKQAHDDQGQTKESNQAHHLLRRLRDMAGMNPFKGIVDVALDTATPLTNGAGWVFIPADNPEFNTAYEAWHKQTLLDFNQYLIGKITESSGDKQELYQEISDQLLEFFNDPYHGLEYKAHFHDQCQYFHDWLKHKYQSMDCDRQFDNSPLKTAVKITETEFKRRLLFQHPADFVAWYWEDRTETVNPITTQATEGTGNGIALNGGNPATATLPPWENPELKKAFNRRPDFTQGMIKRAWDIGTNELLPVWASLVERPPQGFKAHPNPNNNTLTTFTVECADKKEINWGNAKRNFGLANKQGLLPKR